MQYPYPDSFAKTMTSIYGVAGTQWLEQLPQRIQQCSALWDLSDLQPRSHLTYNYILLGKMKEVPIVLKLRCSPAELATEVAALKAFENYGGVKVLGYDLELGAVLIAQVVPGDSLAALFPYHDGKATNIAVDIIHTLHNAPCIEGFASLDTLLPDLNKDHTELMPFIARARELKTELLATQSKQVFLHGDFHHGNILSSGTDQWVVIDPAGIRGDPIYDLALYIRNPIQDLVNLPHATEIIVQRIRDFASLLNYDAQRIYDWVYVQTVCSAYWSLEDGIGVTNHIKFLTVLSAVKLF